MKESTRVVRSKPFVAGQLTAIAIAAKKYWGYSDEQIEKWRSDLTVSPRDIEEELVFHVEKDGKIIGFYMLSRKGAFFKIQHMWVLPEYIGQGIGRQLFQHAKEIAMKKGAKALRVESDPHAEGFYQKMGMKRVEEVASSIPGRGLPVLEKRFPRLKLLEST